MPLVSTDHGATSSNPTLCSWHHSTGLSLKAPFSSPLCSWLKLPLPDAQGSSCIAPSPNPNPNPVRSLKMIPENTHLDKTGQLANRRISSIVRTPARAAALVSVLQGGLSTDQCSGHSAGRHRGNPRPQASASTVSKCQALEMSDAGCSGHRPNKQLQSPGTSIWSTSSIAACLSPKDSLLPLLPLIPMSLQTHQAPHTADT